MRLRRSGPLALVLSLLLAAPGCGREEEAPARAAGTAAPPPAGPALAQEVAPGGPEGSGAPSAPGGSRVAASGPAAEPTPEEGVHRWYEHRKDGKKVGWLHVLWQASSFRDQPSVRDTTTRVVRSGRAMMQAVDVFENRSVTVTERSEDGLLWSMKTTVTEPTSSGARTITEETTWTGTGYDVVSRLGDGEETRRRVEAEEPAHVDVEALLSRRIAAGEAKEGFTTTLRDLDLAGRRLRAQDVAIVGRETVEGHAGPVPCWKVRQRDPETGSEAFTWMDDEGGAVRVKVLGTEFRRVAATEARRAPEEVPSFSITVPATPPLERIFAADRVLLDVRLAHDPDRPLPDFPASPWSRPLGVSGDETSGWTVRVEMLAHDGEAKTAKIPVTDPAFARWLEPTVLMQCGHPTVVAAAKKAVAGETDARKAAQRIADFVFTLRKQSPEVGQTSAVEILEQRRGDCSEHALLFTALCRAVGIPARPCSGFVCIGADWGAHAWSEIWTGQWIGVDPTTCDVGTAARYLFYGYEDEPGSHPGLVSERARGRMTLVATRLEQGKEVVDLRDRDAWIAVDEAGRRAVDRLSGVVLADWPADWTVELQEEGSHRVRGPGVDAWVQARADQGYRTKATLRRSMGEDPEEGTFAGRPALVQRRGNLRLAIVNHERVNVIVRAVVPGKDGDAAWARLERVVAPTFAER
jgi:transglutaminase-like putative cysteine protease